MQETDPSNENPLRGREDNPRIEIIELGASIAVFRAVESGRTWGLSLETRVDGEELTVTELEPVAPAIE